MERLPFHRNEHDQTGAIACLKMFLQYHNKTLAANNIHLVPYQLREKSYDSLITDVAEEYGFRCITTHEINENTLKKITAPFILKKAHKFLIVYSVRKGNVCFADPSQGMLEMKETEFLHRMGTGDFLVFHLLLTPRFYKKETRNKQSLNQYINYVRPYKKYFIQILLGLLAGTALQLLPPFLTQMLVDKGINFRDMQFVNLILVGLIIIQVGKIASQIIREWINFYIGNRINISIVSEFINLILKLPVAFFDEKNIGDILQRIGDHKRVENFITRSLINMIFNIFNIAIFWGVLLYYNLVIFFVFFGSSLLLFGWAVMFLALRKRIDINIFKQNATNQNHLIQMIQGIQEIKLQGSNSERRWEWEKNQLQLYKSQAKMLKVDQAQVIGTTLINELKNIIILYISANLVIDGEITIGMMLAIQYIMGQANQPVYQLVKFLQESQMAILSLRRMSEVNELPAESENENELIDQLPSEKTISFNKLSFSYVKRKNKEDSRVTLQDISFCIPEGKATGIIGPSGCGKTTLLKLLLKFYPPASGEVRVGDINLVNIKTTWWRNQCGSILQDSILFNDSVIHNIAAPGKPVDITRVFQAASLACIKTDIEDFPNQFNTRLGSNGYKISQGQKQRILIARLIYRNPEFVFLDEATSMLDLETEEKVLRNLLTFFKTKTVVMVTHRLHTIRYVENLIVMDKGQVVEYGHPQELEERKGMYFTMINPA